MARSIRDSVTVITGASSGIGRALALEVARRQGTVVALARRGAALSELVRDCETIGGRALAAPADVTDYTSVYEAARRAVHAFGRLDVWINNAAVSAFGRFAEVPLHVHRRVIETNLLGCMHGAYAAIPYMREQASGVIVNVGSVVGTTGQPFTAAYVASKAAIGGFSAALRQELRDLPECDVITALLPSVDTPLFRQAANFTGRAIRALPPVHDPDRVARAIVDAVESPARELRVSVFARGMLLAHRLAPGTVERRTGRTVEREHFQDAAAPVGTGNLYEPVDGPLSVADGWRVGRDHNGGRKAVAMAVTGLSLAAGLAAVLALRDR